MNRADGLIARLRDSASEEIQRRAFSGFAVAAAAAAGKRASGVNGMEMSVYERAARDGARSETEI